MILIIGGLGFVGANTAEALLKLGYDCVLTSHQRSDVPDFLQQYSKTPRLQIEPVDISELDSLRAIGKKYTITGIINLLTGGWGAARGAGAVELSQGMHATITSIANTFQVAQEWGVKRVTLTGAPVMYNGVTELPWKESASLPLTAGFGMEATKKCAEILASYLSSQTKVEYVDARLTAMYGPHYDASRGFFIGRLVHAAATGQTPDLTGMHGGLPYAQDAGDQCYIKDAAMGLALLQTSKTLNHQLYNVASGRPTTNQDIVDAIKKVVPDFDIALPDGHAQGPGAMPSWHMDIDRLRQDTGFVPAFDIDTGIADYIAWVRDGHDR